ncbi:Programmed cell death protein 7 [Cyphomyrmex costatus]|uniref:Programmed cell death protein 7 n=2 Tax=Cyphomyrmex costatus TaxID=456900 RepID=A0A195BXQ1_9HYME|nr:Programmed cell death protein 7 [Cyphomyrmex costatus]
MKEERRARLHAEADVWIRKEQAVIEREKQEENLRKDADMVLSDVRSKRNDTRKYLGILQELQNLREIKANIARARGEKLSLAAGKAFNNTIAKLIEQWTTLDREYAIEEQELKLMLKTDNEKRIEKQTKNLFDDWENVLFGTSILAAKQSYKDIDSFISIRAAWDKFISSENDATTIPIGWIVPERPSSAAWQTCLNKETS